MMQHEDYDLEYPNTPWRLWQLLDPSITTEDWQAAVYHAIYHLEDLPAMNAGRDLTSLIDSILTERQFGHDHFRLGSLRRFYYNAIRPLLPSALRPMMRRMFLSRQRDSALLGWPIEDRYAKFQVSMLRYLAEHRGGTIPYLALWPHGHRYALVLTHDIESHHGQEFVRSVADLEERHGFRSSFNFVAEDYRVDESLIAELKERGFEVGVHGLQHDGKLFRSRASFKERAPKINGYLKRWGSAGFRAPFTHRHPEWMQALQADYDSTFFDTDPFETIPGGTMSVWPFFIGRLVELPFTLTQDHTLVSMLGENSPRLWLDKIAFIERHSGMAMTVTHPDYLRQPEYFSLYEKFLRTMSVRKGYWHALPCEVAQWWRRRSELPGLGIDERQALDMLPEGAVGLIKVGERWTTDDPPTTLVLGPSHQPDTGGGGGVHVAAYLMPLLLGQVVRML